MNRLVEEGSREQEGWWIEDRMSRTVERGSREQVGEWRFA